MEHVQTKLSSWRTMNCSRPLEVTDPTNQTFYWCLQMESPLAVTNHSLKLFHHSRYVVHSFPPYNLPLFWSTQAIPPPTPVSMSNCLSILRLFGFIHSFIHSLTQSVIHSLNHSITHSLSHSFVRSFVHFACLPVRPSVSQSVIPSICVCFCLDTDFVLA